MAPTGPKEKGAKRGEVLKEDTTSEKSGDDEIQPQTATASQFTVGPSSSLFPGQHVALPSISTYGQATGPSAVDNASQNTGLFGSGFYTPSTNPNPYQWGGTSSLPQQISHQTVTPKNPNESIQPCETKAQNIEERTSDPVKPSAPSLPAYTKGSSSRYITSGNGGKEDVSWIEQIPVKKLETIRGPLQDLSRNKDCYSSVYIEFFGMQPLYAMVSDPTISIPLVNCWAQALKLGGAYMTKIFKVNAPVKRLEPDDRLILKDILEPLDDLLWKMDKYSDGRVTGFKLNKQRLVEFTRRLMRLRDESRDGFILQGEGLPSIPHWGLEGNANLFWDANDFEILGACYREEVTQFCMNIMYVYHANATQEEDVSSTILPRQRSNLPTPASNSNERSTMFENAPISQATRVQSFTNQNASIFGNPSRNTASQKLANMLTAKPLFIASAPDPNDPGGNGDDGR